MMNLTIEEKQKVYEHLLTLDCPDLLAALIADRTTWHLQDNETNSISYEILHRFDWISTPEGVNFWRDMYDDAYIYELENCKSTVTPDPHVIRTTKQLATESIFAVIIWIIMIGIVSVLDLKNVI